MPAGVIYVREERLFLMIPRSLLISAVITSRGAHRPFQRWQPAVHVGGVVGARQDRERADPDAFVQIELLTFSPTKAIEIDFLENERAVIPGVRNETAFFEDLTSLVDSDVTWSRQSIGRDWTRVETGARDAT
jgi:hypothetical protein